MVFYHEDHLLVIEFCPFMDRIIRPLNHKKRGGGGAHTQQQQQQKQTSNCNFKGNQKAENSPERQKMFDAEPRKDVQVFAGTLPAEAVPVQG